MVELVNVNARIKEIKEKHSLRQADIAEITGYSINSVKKWMMNENQQYYVNAPVQALMILENWILGGKEKKESLFLGSQEKICDVWSFFNYKGGVGKTTIAFNISLMLSKAKKVLVVDCDPQGNLSSSLIQDPSKMIFTTSDLLMNRPGKPYSFNINLDVIGTNSVLSNTCESIATSDLLFLLKEHLEKYKQIYDYILLDCLPSKGPLYDAVLVASNKIIVPFTADLYDSWGLQDVFQQVKKVKFRKINENIKVAALVANRVDRPLRNFDKKVLESVTQAYPNEICPEYISNSVRLRECKSPAISMSIVDYAPQDAVSWEYQSVLNYILKA
ncbi:MAG: AAA family ATPase [Silvanigrellaceae bacterium]|nr:AAA family ATPase [Silvanigrellaceae bacterium]